MSEKKDILELVPPENDFRLYLGKEKFVYTGHRCGVCYGQGYHWHDSKEGERIKVPCPACEGTGEVQAIVTVAWRKCGERKKWFL